MPATGRSGGDPGSGPSGRTGYNDARARPVDFGTRDRSARPAGTVMTGGRMVEDEIIQIGRAVAGIVRRVTGDAAYHVFLFGSWASGRARERSDIDIGILGPAPLDPAFTQEIREACERLPTLYTVDVVDLCAVRDEFRAVALSEAVELEPAA